MPKWMAGIDAFSPTKAFTLALLLAGVNPKNLLLSAGAGAALAQLGPTTSETVVSLIVYVVLGSVTIAGPVVYYLVGGDRARAALDSMREWLAVHNAAVMTVLFLVFGVKLIGDGLPVLGG
jgi:Sap, sulfolipid-1-addressing protein